MVVGVSDNTTTCDDDRLGLRDGVGSESPTTTGRYDCRIIRARNRDRGVEGDFVVLGSSREAFFTGTWINFLSGGASVSQGHRLFVGKKKKGHYFFSLQRKIIRGKKYSRRPVEPCRCTTGCWLLTPCSQPVWRLYPEILGVQTYERKWIGG